MLLHFAVALVLYGAIVGLHRATPSTLDTLPRLAWQFAQDGATVSEPVAFPHYWSRDTRGQRIGIYATTLRLDTAPRAHWALYARSLDSTMEVRINDVPVSQAPEAERHRFHPLLVPILPNLLHVGDNTIELRVREDPPGSGFLDRTWIGPMTALEPAFAWRQALKVAFPLALSVAGIVIGALVLMLYLNRPKAQFFLWYSMACFTGAIYAGILQITTPLLPAPWWDTLIVLDICWFGIAVALVGMDYVKLSNAAMVRSQLATGLLALVVIATCAAALPGWAHHGYALPLLLAADMLGSAAFIALFAVRRAQEKVDHVPFWMLQVAVLLYVVSIHDNLMLMGFKLPWMTPEDGLYFPFPAVPTLILCTVLLVKRYLAALREAESMSTELAARVSAREAQIEKSYRDLQRADRERAVAAERERLFADMHDGLGGTLMTALARADNRGEGKSQAATAIRDALADLRLMLGTLDSGEQPLTYELAALRERLEPLCADASIELAFNLRGLPDDVVFTPARTLSLMRIVQEACTNALRHAEARHMRVSAETSPGDPAMLSIVVQDDGRGFDPDQAIAAGHRGITNIRRRAQDLDGAVAWERLQPGMRMTLRLPVARSRPA